ncbi:MAG TPA: tRNA 4-thiouridine(8) synthase ThiI, partial [Candidatus Moranbacteria bacterium]|nr:tRNA 4-thiouridine(8) synthase ThiI [Candidatus Moranbacteria bacterium]
MIIIIHYNEIGLKGGNRDWFEKRLVRNIREKIKKSGFSNIEVKRIPGRILLNIKDLKFKKYDEEDL